MAHASRVYTSKPIPPKASSCTLRGQPAVKWKGRGGRIIVAAICESDPSKCLMESRKWYAFYRSKGKLCKQPGYEDKAATEKLAADLETRSARIDAGMLPPEMIEASPLPVRLQRWRDFLVHRGSTEAHADRQHHRVVLVCQQAKALQPSDLNAVKVMAALADLQKNPPNNKPFGPNTAAHYVGACKQFTRWCVLRDKSETVDHLIGLTRGHSQAAKRRTRRALTEKDFARLIDAAIVGPTLRGLDGPERATLYQFAASTGLRAAEIATLTVYSLDLAGRASVQVKAAYAKNRRKDVLPLPHFLVNELGRMVAGRQPTDPLWASKGMLSHSWSLRAAEMIAVDLAAAGLDVVDADGRVYDFHSLRVQFGTDLERAGVSLTRAHAALDPGTHEQHLHAAGRERHG